MATFRLPLGGDVTQAFRIFTSAFSAAGSQFGLININLGRSKAPEVEEEVLQDVGSYGAQLGRIGDGLAVLLAHFRPERELAEPEKKAIRALIRMLDDIADIKEERGRAALRPKRVAWADMDERG
ncbi:hypothetical protein ACFSCV_16200 [Methylopila henanensis]|uniref:Uncharacterized protein n=1 Tax=Methylopila henanensis TaxID=873516 RepID=A0ABW4K8N7_9HYPH